MSRVREERTRLFFPEVRATDDVLSAAARSITRGLLACVAFAAGR